MSRLPNWWKTTKYVTSNCYVHFVRESVHPKIFYKACGECGHLYTKEELIEEDLKIRTEIWKRYKDSEEYVVTEEPVVEDVADIFICPLCTHDF